MGACQSLCWRCGSVCSGVSIECCPIIAAVSRIKQQKPSPARTPSVLPTASYPFARARAYFTLLPEISRTLAPGHRSTPHLAPHEVSRSRMSAADTNAEGGLPAATLDGAPPSFSAQTHAQKHAPHARMQPFNPHAPRSRARNERPARRGSRPPGARGPHASLRPGRASRRP